MDIVWIGEWGEEEDEEEDKEEDKEDKEGEEGRDERRCEWLSEQAKASKLVRSVSSGNLQEGMSTSNEVSGYPLICYPVIRLCETKSLAAIWAPTLSWHCDPGR